jgi:hypothetical protein
MAVPYRGRSNLVRALVALLICATVYANAQNSGQVRKENKPKMTTHATGTFDVKMTPQTSADKDAVVGKYSLDKKFIGDLEGTSQGEMLAIGTAVEGSAGYVAMEKITATLNGRKGTFALQHSGTMTRGAGQLTITVVPDSGTGELAGLSGRMDIKIADGKHYYDFEYTVAEAP